MLRALASAWNRVLAKACLDASGQTEGGVRITGITITLVHMGDSITFGQYVDASVRWTTLVELAVRDELPDGVELHSINRGVSGETTRMGLERFPADVQSLEPDVMTLQFGLNDSNCWQTDRGLPRVSERAFVANLVEMIERGRRFGAGEIILATNHRTLRRIPLPSGEVYEEANARYSELAREVAAEAGVALCDIRARFEPMEDEELERMLLPYPDHLHLSQEGNAVYANAILPYVDRAVSAAIERGDVLERR